MKVRTLLIVFSFVFCALKVSAVEPCAEYKPAKTIEQSDLIVVAELLDADFSDSELFAEDFGTIDYKFATYRIQQVLKGQATDNDLIISFLAARGAKLIDKSRPKLNPEYFVESQKYILVLRENLSLEKLLNLIETDKHHKFYSLKNKKIFSLVDCSDIIVFNVDEEQKMRKLITQMELGQMNVTKH